MPLAPPDSLSVWKKSRNVFPAPLSVVSAGKNSPKYFAFCAARLFANWHKTGSSRRRSTPSVSQHPSQSLGTSLDVTKLPSMKTLLHPAARNALSASFRP